MDYQKHYKNLINTRKLLIRNKEYGIYEKRHILPKSLGGTNKKENLVLLTPKEHYIAHLLLAKMYIGKDKAKMCYALLCMCIENKLHKRNNYSAKRYENARMLLVLHCSGKNHSNYGKRASDETKKKMSLSRIGEKNGFFGKRHSNETKNKIKKKRKFQIISKHSEKTKMLLSEIRIGDKNPFFGKIHSAEAKNKISLRSRGTCWIHNPALEKCKLIKQNEIEIYLNAGWVKGRFHNKGRSPVI